MLKEKEKMVILLQNELENWKISSEEYQKESKIQVNIEIFLKKIKIIKIVGND